jgi:hypothetical protein
MKDLLFRKVSAATQHQPLFAALRLQKTFIATLFLFLLKEKEIQLELCFSRRLWIETAAKL